MPSTTKKQAHLMSAIDHGWVPPAGSKAARISKKVAVEFHTADKKVGKWEHPSRKAAGGSVKGFRW